MRRSKAKKALAKKQAHRRNQSKARKRAKKGGQMPEKDFAAVLAGLDSPDHVELIPVLHALSVAKADKLETPGGFNLSQLLALYAKYGPILEGLYALYKQRFGGKPADVPKIPDVPIVDDEEEDGPTKPVPPAGRTISGVATARWFHFMEGDPGKVKPMNKARFDSIVTGDDPLNGDLKSRLVADITPLLSDGSKLLTGMPENALVDAKYAVIFDGQRYEVDEIANSPVVLNNLDANFRLTPRFVMGPGIAGKHTFAAEVNLNGTGWVRIKANQSGAVDELRIG
jgi:hypothetical protein